jgi:hypothetical protein
VEIGLVVTGLHRYGLNILVTFMLNVCGFRHNRSTTDQIFCICQILDKKWEYNETAHQLFIDCKKAYDSVRREVLYSILIEFGIPMKLVRLIKMCSKVPCRYTFV